MTELGAELRGLWDEVAAEGGDPATAERVVRAGAGHRGAAVGSGGGGTGHRPGRPAAGLSLWWGGVLRPLSPEAGADAGGVDHDPPRRLQLRAVRPGAVPAGCDAGAGAG